MLHLAQRRRLHDTSWVEVVPGFLTGGELLLEPMLTDIAWEQRQRWMYTRVVDEPRLTAEFPNIADAPDIL